MTLVEHRSGCRRAWRSDRPVSDADHSGLGRHFRLVDIWLGRYRGLSQWLVLAGGTAPSPAGGVWRAPRWMQPGPDGSNDLAHALRVTDRRGVIVYAGGRSYGDAALNGGGQELLTCRLDRLLDFDPASGVVVAEAGVSFDDLRRPSAPRVPIAGHAGHGFRHTGRGGGQRCAWQESGPCRQFRAPSCLAGSRMLPSGESPSLCRKTACSRRRSAASG